MRIQNERSMRPLVLLGAAGLAALVLTLGLLVGLSRSQALAQSPTARLQTGIDVAKSVSANSAVPSQTLHYTITIYNYELSNVTVRLSDPLPAGVRLSGTVHTLVGTAGFADGVITWTHDMPTLSWNRVTFSVVISPTDVGGWITNTATITASGGLSDTAAVATYISVRRFYYLPLVLRNFPPAPTLNAIPAPDANASYTVSWGWPGGVPSGVSRYILQQSSTADFASITREYTTTGTSQVVNDAFEIYYYRVRADSDTVWSVGPWSNIQAGQAAPKPVPTLNPIPAPDGNASYVVSWSWPGGTPAGISRYVLQQSLTSNFASINQQWTTTATSQQVTNAYAVYYYRVRADSDTRWGVGPWSNVQVGQSAIYYDDFSNSASGWPIVTQVVIPETNSAYRLRYATGGYYRISIDAGGPPIWFYQPDALAPYRPPSDRYCVETLVRIRKGQPPYEAWNYYPYWANGGLVFGANEANNNLYAVCLTVGSGEDLGWFIVNNPTYSYPKKGCNYTPGVKGGEPAGTLNITQWHRFQVSVDGDQATVYVNGINKGTYLMSGLSATTRVGLIGGDYEVTPVDFWFDYFRVTPNAACVP